MTMKSDDRNMKNSKVVYLGLRLIMEYTDNFYMGEFIHSPGVEYKIPADAHLDGLE